MDCVRCLPVDLRAGTCPPSSVKPYWATPIIAGQSSRKCRRRPSGQAGEYPLRRTATWAFYRLGGARGTTIVGAQRRQQLGALGPLHELRRIQWERGITRSTNVQQLKRAASFHGQVLELGTDRIRRATPFVSPPGNLPKSASASSSAPACTPLSVTFPAPRRSWNQTSDRKGALNPA